MFVTIVIQYFEYDDPELYVRKVKYIEENSVDGMELMFAEEEYKNGQLYKVKQQHRGTSSTLPVQSFFGGKKISKSFMVVFILVTAIYPHFISDNIY